MASRHAPLLHVAIPSATARQMATISAATVITKQQHQQQQLCITDTAVWTLTAAI
jgi:hypothetical protein